MHFPFELLCIVGLVGRGSRWRAGVGYLPPGHASALKSGKTGVLGADGEPEVAPSGRKLTDEEKAKIAKTDAEMIAKEKAERAKKKGGYAKEKSSADKKNTITKGKTDADGFTEVTISDSAGGVLIKGVSKNGYIFDKEQNMIFSEALRKPFYPEGKISTKQAKSLIDEISSKNESDPQKISEKVRYAHRRQVQPKELTTMTGEPIDRGVVQSKGKPSGGGFRKADVILPILTRESGKDQGMGMKVSGEYKGDFVAARRIEGGSVSVSHIPSGFRVGDVDNMKKARALIDDLNAAKLTTLPASFSDGLRGKNISPDDMANLESIAANYLHKKNVNHP